MLTYASVLRGVPREHVPLSANRDRHLHGALIEQDYTGPAVAEIRTFVDGFLEVVSPAMPHATALEKRLAAIHVWSTLFELAMLPELFRCRSRQ